jgi:hypothetical protein
MINLMIFEFVMKSGHVHHTATSAADHMLTSDVNEAAEQLVANFSKLEALSGYDPRTKRHWRIVTDEVAIVEAYAGITPAS